MRSLSALLALWCLGCASFAAAPPARVPAEWLKLIDQLGDDDADRRAAAEKRLVTLGEDVLPELRRAQTNHDDPDVRLRAVVVAVAIEKRGASQRRQIGGYAKGAIVVAVSPDGRRVASGSVLCGNEYAVSVWGVENGKQTSRLGGGRERILSIVWSKDGQRILTASGRSLTLWDVKTAKRLQTLSGHDGTVFHGLLTPDGKRVVSCGADKTVRVWNLSKGKQIAINRDNEDRVYSLALSGDGRHFVCAGKDGTLRVCEAESGKQLRKIENAHGGFVVSFVVTAPCGKRIASCGGDDVVRLWDVQTGRLLREYKGHEQAVETVAFSNDGRRLISGGYDREVYVWDVESGKMMQTLYGHTGTVSCAAFLPGDRVAVTGGFDRTIRLWTIRP